jgi:hypothetical protein
MKKVLLLLSLWLVAPVTAPSALAQDIWNPSHPMSPLNPLNPASPLNTSSSGSGGGTVSAEYSRAIELMVAFDRLQLTMQSLTVRGYQDPKCGGMGWVKDCNPEFRVQLLVCRADDCTVRSGTLRGWARIQSQILRMASPNSNLGRSPLLTVDLYESKVLEMLESVISESGSQDYRIGFRLLEYNRYDESTVVSETTFPLSELSGLDGHRFTMRSADGKMQAEMQLGIRMRQD